MSKQPPFDQVQPVLSFWLTREEFLTVFAFQWVAWQYDCYGAEDMPESAKHQIFDSFGVAMRWAIAKLGAEYGLEFQGLVVDDDGSIQLRVADPICPDNAMFLYRLRVGKMPNLGNAIRVALRHLSERGIQIDEEPMRAALAEWNANVQEAKEALDPEVDRMGRESFRKIMESIGFHRADTGPPKEEN